MTDTNRLADLKRALGHAHDHLHRCMSELERWEEPQGGDHRGTLQKLTADVVRAESDVQLLRHALWAAQHAQEAFAD